MDGVQRKEPQGKTIPAHQIPNSGFLSNSSIFQYFFLDYLSLYALALSGYNIEDTVNFWRMFAVEVPNSIYASTTHPSTSERFIRMEAAIKEIQEKINNGDILLPTYDE